MESKPLPVYRCSGQSGFSPAVSGNPRRLPACKLEHEVGVRFTSAPCTVHTREGTVQAKAGDAILTGIAGEQWRVSHARFLHKYRPIPPTVAGDAGRYMSLRNRVLVLEMREPFTVLLADGTSELSGRTGDWLVDYGDGSLGIVAAPIFAKTYELLG